MNLISLAAIASDHKRRLQIEAAASDAVIADLRRMAGEAITEMDRRHKKDTGSIAVLFEGLIAREQKRLDEINKELAGEHNGEPVLPMSVEKKKGKNHV